MALATRSMMNQADRDLVEKAFQKACSSWHMTPEQKQKLCADDPDLMLLVISLYKTLHTVFSDPEQANAWIRIPNNAEVFGGDSPLHRMLHEGLPPQKVKDYLDRWLH